MTIRISLLLAAMMVATPALAGGHPNGKPKEFYAIQRGTDRKPQTLNRQTQLVQ